MSYYANFIQILSSNKRVKKLKFAIKMKKHTGISYLIYCTLQNVTDPWGSEFKMKKVRKKSPNYRAISVIRTGGKYKIWRCQKHYLASRLRTKLNISELKIGDGGGTMAGGGAMAPYGPPDYAGPGNR